MESVIEIEGSECKRPYTVTLQQWAADGSMVRNLMSFQDLGLSGPGLSEVSVPAGWRTAEHAHHYAELYHVLTGAGWVEIDGQRLGLAPGDTVAIPPNVRHHLEARLDGTLHMLWCHDGAADPHKDGAPAQPAAVKRPTREIASALPERVLPSLIVDSGNEAEELRLNLVMTQAAFWSRVFITQGGGSRYEAGRDIPLPVRFLLHLVYSSDPEAQRVLNHLRRGQSPDDCPPKSFSFAARDSWTRSVRALRTSLGLNQTTFWGRIHLPQSAGSRYEGGRSIPKPIQTLIMLAYAPLNEAENLLAALRVGVTRRKSKMRSNSV